ncbi:MAG TPA: hypothetical protein VI193_11270 [Acidimicrobiia bacterium]
MTTAGKPIPIGPSPPRASTTELTADAIAAGVAGRGGIETHAVREDLAGLCFHEGALHPGTTHIDAYANRRHEGRE